MDANLQKKADTLSLNRVKIDSLLYKIPLQFVDTLPGSHYKPNKLVSADGDILSEYPIKNKIESNGITSNWYIQNSKYGEYLHLFVNSKMLKEKYPNGINIDNAFSCYEFILSRYPGLFLTYDNFLNNGISFDIDICSDYYKPGFTNNKVEFMNTVKNSVLDLSNKWITQKSMLTFFTGATANKKRINNKTTGAEINKRGISDLHNRHAKIYCKYSDSLSKPVFFENHAPELLTGYIDVLRGETKLHNAEQLRSVVGSNKFIDVLKFDFEDTFNMVFSNYGLNWITGYSITQKNESILKISDIIEDAFFKEKVLYIEKDFQLMVLTNNQDYKMYFKQYYVENKIHEILERIYTPANVRKIKSRKGEQIKIFSKFIAEKIMQHFNAGFN
jgi:hypothetical protein